MADNQGNQLAKNYHLDNPQTSSQGSGGFFLKGAGHCDWGLQSRLARMFRPASGNTVMLAFDHGYIMGPTSGLERLDLVIPPLIPFVDVLMATRGALRSSIPPTQPKPVCLRVNYDSSVLYDDMSLGGGLACDIRNAVRMHADCMAVQTFIGAPGEKNSLELLSRTVDAGLDYGIPTLGVVAVGKQMARDEKFFLLATRLLAETGCHLVKSYYCEGFERVAAACPVPIVIAGGKKLPELDALLMCERAINEGARGVDMGRNIFQSENPAAMCRAVAKVVHEKHTAKQAHELFLNLCN
ncbi:MAG: 3-hydroxy-5-phosphonooxypentane-2,4-dione thiolase [Deltaproteobacteria bacterium]|jgi:putative autoinducer-2 (AI-2) aldolase|nr:3-hydroxy-5-phosphonooxypentane-2,4-dione thiolase [Deltaproteobacteria bacterium]